MPVERAENFIFMTWPDQPLGDATGEDRLEEVGAVAVHAFEFEAGTRQASASPFGSKIRMAGGKSLRPEPVAGIVRQSKGKFYWPIYPRIFTRRPVPAAIW